MERSKSFLHRPSPAPKRSAISRLANRSHSIADVLHVVESGKGHLVAPEAYLPDPSLLADSPSRPGAALQRSRSPPPDQAELFRMSSFVGLTSVYNKAEADLKRLNEMHQNVVLFPKELRGNNRFFTSPELGQKANTLVQFSRRPSSLFSDAISEGARQELSAIHRIKKYEDIKLRNYAPKGNRRPLSQPFRPLDKRSHDEVISEDGFAVFTSSFGTESPGPGDVTTCSPKYLLHIPAEDRDTMHELEKYGRRVEYGRMVGMFREEILASKIDGRYAKVPKHPEVESKEAAKHHEVVIDWTFCDIDDPLQLMDIPPRDGIVHLEGTDGKSMVRQRIAKKKSASDALPESTSRMGEKPPVFGVRKSLAARHASGLGHKSVGDAGVAPSASVANAIETSGAPIAKNSPIWKLKYCFNDDDAEGIIDIQRGLVVVETAGQKYAFDPTKLQTSRDLDAEHEGRLSPEKRARLKWQKMSPEEREKHRIHRLLSCGRAYEGHHVNIASNGLTRVDGLLTNTLATILKLSVTKLDLSFNQIQVIDWTFLNVNPQSVEERKRATLIEAAAQEEEEMRLISLSNGGLLSETQQKKQREAFLQMRRRAVADLVDIHAAHRLFHGLQTLLLHGNPLRDIEEIWKLEPLRYTLKYLTFHGHHSIDAQASDPRNRLKIRALFPKLVQLNFTTLLPWEDDAPRSGSSQASLKH